MSILQRRGYKNLPKDTDVIMIVETAGHVVEPPMEPLLDIAGFDEVVELEVIVGLDEVDGLDVEISLDEGLENLVVVGVVLLGANKQEHPLESLVDEDEQGEAKAGTGGAGAMV